MAESRLSVKLAVILRADVADSTRQQDEQVAHERIQETYRRFLSPNEINDKLLILSSYLDQWRGRIQWIVVLCLDAQSNERIVKSDATRLVAC